MPSVRVTTLMSLDDRKPELFLFSHPETRRDCFWLHGTNRMRLRRDYPQADVRGVGDLIGLRHNFSSREKPSSTQHRAKDGIFSSVLRVRPRTQGGLPANLLNSYVDPAHILQQL